MLLGQNITDAECFELVESKQGELLSRAVFQVPAAEAAGAQL